MYNIWSSHYSWNRSSALYCLKQLTIFVMLPSFEKESNISQQLPLSPTHQSFVPLQTT